MQSVSPTTVPLRAILLAFEFPPLSSGGVHRALGFAQTLPSLGIELECRDGSGGGLRAMDSGFGRPRVDGARASNGARASYCERFSLVVLGAHEQPRGVSVDSIRILGGPSRGVLAAPPIHAARLACLRAPSGRAPRDRAALWSHCSRTRGCPTVSITVGCGLQGCVDALVCRAMPDDCPFLAFATSRASRASTRQCCGSHVTCHAG